MKITNVEVVLVDRPAFTPAFVWRKGIPGSDGPITAGWLIIETDAGITGFASAARGVNASISGSAHGNSIALRDLRPIWRTLWM